MSIVLPAGSSGAELITIIKLALKDIGAISGRETPTDDETQDAFESLKQMLAYWRTQTLVVYCQKKETITCNGSTSYTIGSGADLNIERPCMVDAVKWLLNDVGTPLIPLHSFEDYQDIQINTITGVPSAFYYRPAYPEGQLFVWPIPNSGTLEIVVRETFPQYATVFDEISLPPEYEPAVRFNLATWMAPTFGLDVPPKIERLARETKRALKINNTQLKTMRMPDAVQSTTMYNIRSGY
jgi:hypothetical protein